MVVIILKSRSLALLCPNAAAAAASAATTGDDVDAIMVSVLGVLFVDLPHNCLHSFACWVLLGLILRDSIFVFLR